MGFWGDKTRCVVGVSLMVLSLLIFIFGINLGVLYVPYPWVLGVNGATGGFSSMLLLQGVRTLWDARRHGWEDSGTWQQLDDWM